MHLNRLVTALAVVGLSVAVGFEVVNADAVPAATKTVSCTAGGTTQVRNGDRFVVTCTVPGDSPVSTTLTAHRLPVTSTSTISATPTPTMSPTATMSATPTATATPTQPSGCTKPTSATAGAQGTMTKTLTGEQKITTAGTVITDTHITGGVEIDAANVTLRNDVIDSGVYLVQAPGATIDHVTSGDAVTNSSSKNFTLTNSVISDNGDTDPTYLTSDRATHIDGVTMTGNLVQLTDFDTGTSNHVDGLQVRGADNVVISCNAFEYAGAFHDIIDAAVYIEDANGGNHNVAIDHNWLDGPWGYYSLRIMTATGLSITNNAIDGSTNPCFNHSPGFTAYTQSGNTVDGAAENIC